MLNITFISGSDRIHLEMVDSFPRWQDWHWQQQQAIRELGDLENWVHELAIPAGDLVLNPIPFDQLLERYQMAITPYYLSLATEMSYSDPILRQLLPDEAELSIQADELDDPIGDEDPKIGSRPNQTIIHRHADRALFLVTPMCSVYCRYCFRKRLVGKPEFAPDLEELEIGLNYLRVHNEIQEVILTGGDPLILADEKLMNILEELAAIPHIKLLRIHSRLPVVNPFRLTLDLGRRLAGLQKPLWLVTHFNHARELTLDSKEGIERWTRLGIPFLNQAVLLKGVNNNADDLEALFRGLIEQKVRPYYLHQADLVKGTGHLRTTIEEGLALMKELQSRLPGYAIPHYVLDRPGGSGKVPLQNDYL